MGTVNPALNSSYALWDTEVEQMDGLLARKVESDTSTRNLALFVTAAVLLLVVYMWGGFYHAIMRTVTGMEEATRRMAAGLSVGTFHRTCAEILRRDGQYVGVDPHFSIYDDGEQVALLRSLLREDGIDEKRVPPRAILSQISRAKAEFGVPLAAYSVSGEYAMIRAAGQLGWLDEERAILEALTGIRRAGADIVITYFAKHAARLLERGLHRR